MPFKLAVTDKTEGKSFLKLVVKVREQIVADGLQPEDYDVTDVGAHLTAKDWNEAIEKHDPVVVDMRNHYESEIGHFEGAVLPEAETFREELPMVLDNNSQWHHLNALENLPMPSPDRRALISLLE